MGELTEYLNLKYLKVLYIMCLYQPRILIKFTGSTNIFLAAFEKKNVNVDLGLCGVRS